MNKYVLTGGPSSGKTTLIDCLKEREFNVLSEIARPLIDERRKMGIMDPDEKKEQRIIQGLIYAKQLEMEAGLNGELVFLDRGIHDNIAYSQHLLEKVPNYMYDVQLTDRYDYVFVLDRLPFVDDGMRVESGDEEAQVIHDLIIGVCERFGYNVINVPIFDGKTLEDGVNKRADYILERIK